MKGSTKIHQNDGKIQNSIGNEIIIKSGRGAEMINDTKMRKGSKQSNSIKTKRSRSKHPQNKNKTKQKKTKRKLKENVGINVVQKC